ncbi:MAG: DUF503 domain-containing protein, partial [Angustibacter sp.]
MWIGSMSMDILFGDVHSLKEKRSLVSPIVAHIHRKFQVSAAQVGHLDVHRRAEIGVALVAADREHIVEVLDRI